MKRYPSIIALAGLLATAVQAQSWTFDNGPVLGVSGQAMAFDGDTTRLIMPAADVTALGQTFTLKATVAPNTYPWNRVPLLDQSLDRQSGYSLELDAFGHVSFAAAIGGTWQTLTTATTLPLRQWSQVTATFDGQALAIFINGHLQARLETSGAFMPADRADLYIGHVREPQLPYPSWLIHPKDPVAYAFDGYLDDVQAHPGALSDKTIRAAAKPPAGEIIPLAVLPSGPAGAGPFGAYATKLAYTPSWDNGRRTADQPDIVVRFEHSGMRLVFWQGLSYVPAWVTENNKWYTDQFLETYTAGCPDGGDCEPMSDRQNLFSRVEIVESSPARAVIHWRYALIDSRSAKGAYANPETGWFDWADEYWTIYPDGVAIRQQVLQSSAPEDAKDFHEWQESIVINGPGQRPEDNIEPDALTLVNMAGDSHIYSWQPKTNADFDYPKGPDKLDLPVGANIQQVNLKSREKPFQVVPPDGAWYDTYNGEKSYSMFEWWNHWPTAQINSSGRPAVAPDRASHSSLSHIHWRDYEKRPEYESKLLMTGLTTRTATELVPVAKSWLNSPEIAGVTYDPAQRAYVLDKPAMLQIPASQAHPVVNPAFVIRHWPGGMPVVTVDGTAFTARTGVLHALEGDSLVVYLPLTADKPIRITISAAPQDGHGG